MVVGADRESSSRVIDSIRGEVLDPSLQHGLVDQTRLLEHVDLGAIMSYDLKRWLHPMGFQKLLEIHQHGNNLISLRLRLQTEERTCH